MSHATRLDGWGRVLPAGTSAQAVNEASLPVIDFSAMRTGDAAAKRALALKLRAACVDVGFFYLRNHGIPQDLVDAVFAQCARFFGQSLDAKMKIATSTHTHYAGFTPLLAENADTTGTGDLHESFDVWTETRDGEVEVAPGRTKASVNLWPEGLPGFRETLNVYHDAMLDLSRQLCGAMALALDLPEKHFEPLMTRPHAHLRMNYYPPQDKAADESRIGIGAHTDYQCFTILAQDRVPALQVVDKRGEWVLVPPLRGDFVINIGDTMARWTNDTFKSTMHRAINLSGEERYSIPYFFGVNYDAVVETLPGCITPERPLKYEPVTAGDYVLGRLRGVYGAGEDARNPERTIP